MTGPPSGANAAIQAMEAAFRAGDLSRAGVLADQVLAGGGEHPLALTLRARRWEGQGRWAEATADLRRALALAPADPQVLTALGQLLSRLGQLDEARALLGRAVALSPGAAAAWNAKGVAELGAGDVAAARASFEAAVAQGPGLAEPHGRLAELAARRGDWAAARQWAASGLALDPNLADATRALARAELAGGQIAAAEARLRDQLQKLKWKPAERYQSLGLLGDTLDRQGRYPQAFAAYRDANTQLREIYAPRFGRSGLTPMIEALRQAVDTDWPAAPTAAAAFAKTGPASQHVFLIGFMRSGTTLIEQVLAAEPGVVTLEEQEAFDSSVNAYMTGRDGMARLRDAGEAELARHRADYWARVRRFGVDPTSKVFVDKKPFDGVKLPLIQRLFPGARIVFTVRDPRDVIFSCFKHRFSVTSYTFELLDLASAVRFYDAYMRSVETYRQRLPITLHSYRHEDLVADFEGEVRKICAFLGLAWRDEMRDVGRRSREGRVSSPSALQLVNGLSNSGLQQWRRYQDQLAPFYADLEPWVRRFGYD